MNLHPVAPWRSGNVELFLLEPAHVTESYVGWLNDREVMRYLESRFDRHDLASTVAYVAAMRASPDVLMLGIRSDEIGRHVGNIKLGPLDRRHGLGEVGLMIGDRHAWGRGIAAHAIGILAAIGAKQLGLRKLTAGCYASNGGSVRAFEKAGFEVEGTRRNHFLLDGRGEDLVLLAMHLGDPVSMEGRG